jgi:RND superfamily putative drug exporter
LIRLATASVRRPLVALAAWLVIVALLALIGRDLSSQTSPTILVLPGTESSAAQELTQSHFGDSTLVPVLLEGPPKALDQQGPQVVRDLRARRDTRVLSPWDKSPGTEALRPEPRTATILAAVERSREDVVAKVHDQIERTVQGDVEPPVIARVTGQAAVDQALEEEAVDATRRAMFLSLPVIFLLLLVAFRAPVPALVCTALAASVVPATLGALAIAARFVEVDAVAAAFGAMVGLALSVAFAGLIVARYREELGPRGKPGDATVAATASVATAGRTVLLAATAMVVSMTLASMLAPTSLLISVGLGATLATIVGAVTTVGVGSALLTLIGERIHAFAPGYGPRAAGAGSAVPLLARLGPLGRHPAVVAGVALVALLVLTAPVLDFQTGEPDVETLPADNQARKDFERLQDVMGAGATSPFEITIVNRGTAITTRAMLKRLDRLQKRIAHDPRVAGVVGPGPIAAQAEDLQGVPRGLKTAADTVKKSEKDLPKLIDGLGQAGDGVKQLRSGLAEAADGAGQLDDGAGQAADGSRQLSDGLRAAAVGSTQLATGIGTASDGADQLADGSKQASGGAKQLADGLGTADTTVKNGLPLLQTLATGAQAATDRYPGIIATAQTESDGIDQALSALESAPPALQADPAYQAVLAPLRRADGAAGDLSGQLTQAQADSTATSGGVSAVVGQVTQLSDGLGQLRAGADQLSGGLDQLTAGNSDLAAGLKQLNEGGGALQDGLGLLSAGSTELAGGLGQLHDGTGQLRQGLSGGYDQSAPLEEGMGTIQSAVSETEKKLPRDAVKDYARLTKSSPKLFDSGYYTLAAVDGAPHSDLDAASFVVNVDRGGLAARISVTPKWPAKDDRIRALRGDLEEIAAGFADATGTEWAVGGTGAQLQDFRSAASSRIPLVIAGLLIAGFILLVAVTRGILVPAVAMLLNLLVLAATFGVLGFLFGHDHPLGGPGYIDPISAIGIITVILGLSVDYQVFLLARVREEYDTGSLETAMRYGLRSTRGVLTGAAFVMLAVFLAFARTELVTVRQFAIGVGVAVLIDATIVRLVLLPLLVRRLGTRGWTLPQAIGDRLPRVHLSPSPAAERRRASTAPSTGAPK